MRKLIYGMNLTLDCFVAAPGDEEFSCRPDVGRGRTVAAAGLNTAPTSDLLTVARAARRRIIR